MVVLCYVVIGVMNNVCCLYCCLYSEEWNAVHMYVTQAGFEYLIAQNEKIYHLF